ncbi:hypothetical protein MGSAQ_000717 [marine sediment metagenome]|uniref:Uncharacterized protein n=1 Tax=marine sediment metagenome TaxID=412755 RepID=A0A1B6NYC4_9ZZZZ
MTASATYRNNGDFVAFTVSNHSGFSTYAVGGINHCIHFFGQKRGCIVRRDKIFNTVYFAIRAY